MTYLDLNDSVSENKQYWSIKGIIKKVRDEGLGGRIYMLLLRLIVLLFSPLQPLPPLKVFSLHFIPAVLFFLQTTAVLNLVP